MKRNNFRTLEYFFQNFVEKRILFFVLSTVICFVVFLNSLRSMQSFNYTHWLFNYEFEFIKRGFIGELLRTFNIEPTLTVVYIFSYVIFICVLLAYVKFFYNSIKKDKRNIPLLLFFIMAVFHSATLQHFNLDIGRFDHFGLLSMILIFLILPNLSKISQIVLVVSSTSIIILIHDALFLFFIPLIFSFWFYSQKGNFNFNLVRLISLIFLTALTYFVLTEGLFTTISFEEYYSYLRYEYGSQVENQAVLVLFRGIADNINYASTIGFSLGHHFLMAILIIPTLFIFFVAVYKDLGNNFSFEKLIKSQSNLWKIILLLSAFTPLLLYPIGHDRFRWWSITITNLFIICAILLKEESFRNSLINTFNKYRVIIGFIIIFSLIMGPLGVGLSFSNNPSTRFLSELIGIRF